MSLPLHVPPDKGWHAWQQLWHFTLINPKQWPGAFQAASRAGAGVRCGAALLVLPLPAAGSPAQGCKSGLVMGAKGSVLWHAAMAISV